MIDKYLFSVRELLSILITYSSPNYEFFEDSSALNIKLGTNLQSYIESVYNNNPTQREGINQFLENLDILVWNQDSSRYNLAPYVKEILDLFSSRFSEEMILKTYGLDSKTLKKESRKVFDKILDVLCLSYPKYKTMLENYDKTKGDLLRAIEDSYVDYENVTEEDEHTQDNNKEHNSFSNRNAQQEDNKEAFTKGDSRVNDTPQTRDSGGYGNEDYASQIEFAKSDSNEKNNSQVNENDLTASNDKEALKSKGSNLRNRGLYHISKNERDSLIERLNQIELYYQNIYKMWIKEFDSLVWEGANYE